MASLLQFVRYACLFTALYRLSSPRYKIHYLHFLAILDSIPFYSIILFAHFPIYWIGSLLSPSYASIPYYYILIMKTLRYTRHEKRWQSWLLLLLRSFPTLNSLWLIFGATLPVMVHYSSMRSRPLLSNTLWEFSLLHWEQLFRQLQLHSVLPCLPSHSTFLGRL